MKTKIAEQLWGKQLELNIKSRPSKDGDVTKLVGEQLEGYMVDYTLATYMEAAELVSNFYWKHWSAEAKEGKRWQLIRKDESKGEGTAHNVKVELVDLLHFCISVAQGCIKKEEFVKLWEAAWKECHVSHMLHDSTSDYGKAIIREGLQLMTGILMRDPYKFIGHLIYAFDYTGMAEKDVYDAYCQKNEINHKRQERGRKQEGDEYSEQENESLEF